MRWLEGHALGSKTPHQSRDKELQIQTPRHSNIRQAVCSDSELVAPLIVTAVRMKEELQPRTILKGHFLEANKVMWSKRWQEAAPRSQQATWNLMFKFKESLFLEVHTTKGEMYKGYNWASKFITVFTKKQNEEKNGCLSLQTLGDHLSATFPASNRAYIGLCSQPRLLTASVNSQRQLPTCSPETEQN